MHPPRFGLFLLPNDVREAVTAARRAEDDGYYSISVNDHFYSPFGGPRTPQLECFTVLTAMAMVTRRVKLAPAVVAASFRSPALLAKCATTLDHASEGRLILGLGAGWQVSEYVAHDYPFPPTAQRVEELGEHLQILKALWTREEPSFKGRYFSIDNGGNNPKPLQRPGPPIMLGGSAPSILKLAAEHATVLNIIPPTSNGKDFPNDPEATVKFTMEVMKKKIAALGDLMRARGRQPSDMELGGLLLLGLSRRENDPALADMAKKLGYPDLAAAQRSPVALLGTPAEVRDEIARRIEDTGVTYYMMFAATDESWTLFSKEVLPHFAR
ncbi:MAG TPA: LLM class flavin-dependent oxidoreductase [Gammaproteobacteria bacterium]|nr:LLM class flavin-dependent oxidoreductase [Gammaproteobacteria bacterium]